MTSDSPQLRGALFGFRRASVRQLLAGRETMFRFAQERAQAAEAKAETLETELKALQAELIAQTEAADSARAETRDELRAKTEALREQVERVAVVEAMLSELRAELSLAREAEEQQADSMRKLASMQTELEIAQTEVAARAEQARSSEAQVQELQAQLEAAQAEAARQAGEPGAVPGAEAEDLTLMLSAAERGVTGIMERARHAYEAQLAQAELVRETIQADVERFGDWQGHVEPLIRSVQQGIETARGRIVRIPEQIQEAVNSMTDAMTAVSDSLDRLASLPGPLSSDPRSGADFDRPTSAGRLIRLHGVEDGTPRPSVPPTRDSQPDPTEAASTGRSDREAPEAGDAYEETSHRGPSNHNL